MFSIQQLIKSTRKLQASSVSSVSSADLAKNLKHAAVVGNNSNTNTNHHQQTHLETGSVLTMTSALLAADMTSTTLSSSSSSTLSSSSSTSSSSSSLSSPQQQQTNLTSQQPSREEQNSNELKICQRSKNTTNSSDSCSELSLCSHLNESGSPKHTSKTLNANTQEQKLTTNISNINTITTAKTSRITSQHFCKRSQQIQNFYQQQLHQFHTQANQSLWAKQKQTHFTMSSLAATEPLSTLKSTDDISTVAATAATTSNTNGDNGVAENSNTSMTNKGKTCFKSGYPEILQFMELIGNLKHTKRTGWVLRDVNDCESISGHMYRMSMMTFLLDGTEGLNQIRCMELALVHDLAESIVGDLTPFCGISKEEKRAMEFKAMDDICKLIEPRGKRIMELFVEYETGESAESKFVKDLDRLDMVMQAFEYEKRDNCLLKHQEFFDSTEGKFKHPFVQQLVKEIYAQRTTLANAQGATPPPNIVVPDWEHAAPNQSNGHCSKEQAEQSSSSTSTS